MKELAHSKSCIEQVKKYCVQYVCDNGLHPVTWLSCPSGMAITYFLTYIGLTHTFVPLKFCHLGWYRYFVWLMDYMLCFQSVLYCIVLYNDVFTFLYVAVGNKLLLLLLLLLLLDRVKTSVE